MSFSTDQKTSRLFKRLLGVAETEIGRDFYEEPYLSKSNIFTSQIWSQSDLIPTTAPSLPDQGVSGVIQYFANLQLVAIPGTSNAFRHDSLKNSIPHNFGDGSYNYVIRDNANNIISFGQNDWLVDNEAGIIMFYNGIPANMPPKISFYKYVGNTGISLTGSIPPETAKIYFNPDATTNGVGTLISPHNLWASVMSTIVTKSNSGIKNIIVQILTNYWNGIIDITGITALNITVLISGYDKSITKISNGSGSANSLYVHGNDATTSIYIRNLELNNIVNISGNLANVDIENSKLNFASNISSVTNLSIKKTDLSSANLTTTDVVNVILDDIKNINSITNTRNFALSNPTIILANIISNSINLVVNTFSGNALNMSFINCSFKNLVNDLVINDLVYLKAYNTSLVYTNINISSNGSLEIFNSTLVGTLVGIIGCYTPASQLKNDSSVTGITIKDALEFLSNSSSTLAKTWYDSVAEIRAITNFSNGSVVGLVAYESVIYRYDSAETTADDGIIYLKPDSVSGAGRYVRTVILYRTLNNFILGVPPVGKNWSDGFNQFTNLSQGNEAIYDLNKNIKNLAPFIPDDISLSDPSVLPSDIYSAKRTGSGAVDVCTTNLRLNITWQAFYDPSFGTLIALIDDVNNGQITLTNGDNTGTNQSLNIVSNPDAYQGQMGKINFYKVINAKIEPINDLSVGSHTFKLQLSADSVAYTVYVDNPGIVAISGVSGTYDDTPRYISGVYSLAATRKMKTSFTLENAAKKHYNQTRLISINGDGIISHDIAPNVGNGEPYTEDANIIFTDVESTILDSVYFESPNINIIGYNSKDESVTHPYLSHMRIDTVSNESARKVSGSGDYPARYGGVYNSLSNLKTVYTDELQMLNGKYQWPSGNYTSNLPVAGPDYSSGMGVSDRWVTFKPVTLDFVKSFVVNFVDASNFLGIETSGIKIFIKVEGATGWLNANLHYDGVDDLITNGKGIMLYNQSTETRKKITFGKSVVSGDLYVRIGLPAASNKSFNSIQILDIY